MNIEELFDGTMRASCRLGMLQQLDQFLMEETQSLISALPAQLPYSAEMLGTSDTLTSLL